MAASAIYPAATEAATISDVLSEIGKNNLAIKADRADMEFAIRELQIENSLPATSFEYSPFFFDGDPEIASSEMIVSQEFEFPSVYVQRAKANAAEKEAAGLELNSRRNEILLEAKMLCLDLILLREKSEITEKRLESSKAILSALEKKREYNAVTQLELNKAKISIEDLNREKLQYELARMEIVDALTAMNAGLPLALDGLEYEVNSATYILPDNLDDIISRDSRVLAAETRTNVASRKVTLSKNEWLPGFNLGYRRNTEYGTALNGMLLGASFPLFSAGKKVKAAKAGLAAARMQAEKSESDVRLEKESELRQLQLSSRLLSTYNMELMEETIALYDLSLKESQIDITTYYTEISILYDRLLTRAELENSWQKQLARLNSNL